jgi:PAS domain S-box-containing protein
MTLTSHTSSHPLPQILGYLLVEEIYVGDRTIVYRAVEESGNQCSSGEAMPTVIIKILRPDYPHFNDLLQFRNQYTIAKNLDLPGIVRSDSLNVYGNSYALVMEDFGGISLHQYRQDRSLSVGETLIIASQIATTLHALHQHRIIHKDIKPANILIHPESKQIKLIDFSIASLLPKETPEIKHPRNIEGTLAYLAPEQTGRMNRGIDYRADFYSLGVTLSELLTGELPFTSDDPSELLHCHIARSPVPIEVLNPHIPTMVSEIVAKLMSKNAEDRYQTALGLQHDLNICSEQWEATGTIDRFELGMRDLSDRFTIPAHLYGREREIQTLLASFDRVASPAENRVCNGAAELILVAGCSGIGKTAIVNEVHKPITRQHGYFIKGKFDQFNRHLPLSAFVQALRDLTRQLLSESDSQLQIWRTQLSIALGDSAQVIVEVIPELEQIIGSQPPAIELSGTAAQHRFNRLFQKFIQVFTTPAHPLTIFLDDLQWVDSASLKLMQLLLAAAPGGYLLLIGAYRDNEVSIAHPLMLTLTEIVKSQATVQTIALEPLSIDHLNQLVAETLTCKATIAQPLTSLIYQKTQGNPFFATQFLKALHQDNLLWFDRQVGYWHCELTKIQSAALTDDVVEFMAIQLQKLPRATQNILKLAACIGDSFDLHTLAIISGQTAFQVADDLWIALQAVLVVPQSEVYKFFGSGLGTDETDDRGLPFARSGTTYRFLHDRVQQAAYSLIPVDRRQVEQLQIGRLLLAQADREQQGVKLFDLVNRLNIGRSLMTDPLELTHLAQLNLAAAQKARLATAYQSALEYASSGISLLTTIGWQQQYDLLLSLHYIAAETAFLQGELDRSTNLVATVIKQAKTILDRVPVYETQIQLFSSQKNYPQAIEWGLKILAQLGLRIPANPSKLQLLGALAKTKLLLSSRSIETLLQLPLMQNPQTIAAMRILDLLSYPAYDYSKSLLSWMAFVGVERSVAEGNSIWSARAYSLYSVVLANVRDFAGSYQMGQLALRLFDLLPNLAIEAKVKFDAAFFSQPCRQPLRDSLPLHQAAVQAAFASGDLLYGGKAYYGDCAVRMHLGEPLDELLVLAETYRQAIVVTQDRSSIFLMEILYQLILKLQRPDLNPHHLLDSEATDLQTMAELARDRGTLDLSVFYAYKQYLAYIFADIPTALKYADLYVPFEHENSAPFSSVQLAYIEALIRLAAYPDSLPKQQQQLLARVTQIQKTFARRAKLAPFNLQVKSDLIAAERCRVLGEHSQAIELYDRSIAGAMSDSDLQQAAFSNELAAKFYLGWGKEKIAAVYLQEAYYCFARWGAIAKTEDLKNRYLQLLAPILQPQQPEFNPLSTLASIIDTPNSLLTQTASTDRHHQIRDSNYFDLASVLQSAQALSSTLDLEALLQQLIQIILKNSGAQTCILALPDRQGEWQIQSIVTVNSTSLLPHQLPQPLTDDCDYPVNSIHWVKNTQQSIIFDASKSLEITDRYLRKYQPQSVFCLPILQQSEIFGVIYLEHRHTPDLFTANRQIVISFLCTQAAIALENAQLYRAAQVSAANLQSQRNYLETLLNNIPHMAWLKDEDSRYIAANRAFGEFFGYGSIELAGKTDLEILPADLAQRCRAEDSIVMESGECQVAEEQILLPNDEYCWLETIKTPIKNSDGKITGTVGISLNITDRKEMEIALRKSEEKYHKLSDNIPGVIYKFRVATDGRISFPYISSGCQELFQLSAMEVMADSDCLMSLIHPDDFLALLQVVAESSRNLTYKLWEGRVTLASGQMKWIKSASRPELQSDDSIVWDGILLNISDLKQAELNLATSQQKYYSLIQSIPGVVWEYDLELDRFSFVSDRAEALLGYPVEAWLSQPDFWRSRIYSADLDTTMQVYDNALRNRQNCEFEYRLVTADDRLVWVYDISTPVFDRDGKLIATTGLLIDITEKQAALDDRQQAEIALQQTNERLESTNQELLRVTRLKDEFLATMSHELRTPLNAILGMSECLQEEIFGSLNERQSKSIGTIDRSGQHLLSLINDILDVSKIAAGKLELEISKVPISHLCNSSLAFVKQQADRKQIRLKIDLPTQIGEISVDRRRMVQVIINLLSNAVKFTPRGGSVTLGASIAAADLTRSIQGDWICLSVTDTGIGISPADRDKLFQPFIQVDSSLNRQYEGTGLGLALVKQIVELHGGYVALESELGQGSCFRVYLPYTATIRERSTDIATADKLESYANDPEPAIAVTQTILLAEDNQANVITFASYLNGKGYQTIVAKNGFEAIELAETQHPHLILMDIQMPGMDGITAIGQIRQNPELAKIPIIALTALAMESDLPAGTLSNREQCLAAGANEYITKPIKLKELNHRIQYYLELT